MKRGRKRGRVEVRDGDWGGGRRGRDGAGRWGVPNINSSLQIRGAGQSALPGDAHVVSDFSQ